MNVWADGLGAQKALGPWSWSSWQLWTTLYGCWDLDLGPLEEKLILVIEHPPLLFCFCFSLRLYVLAGLEHWPSCLYLLSAEISGTYCSLVFQSSVLRQGLKMLSTGKAASIHLCQPPEWLPALVWIPFLLLCVAVIVNFFNFKLYLFLCIITNSTSTVCK